jgi:hypothetical protein
MAHSQVRLSLRTVEDIEPPHTCRERVIHGSARYSDGKDNTGHPCPPNMLGVQEHIFRNPVCTAGATTDSHGIYVKSKGGKEEKGKFLVSIRVPVMLVNKVWEFQAMRARQGWDINISTYNIVPDNSLVFLFARSGNIRGLQELFRSGLASPFDRNECGFTVLHVSSISKF